jgi:excisionase family DNA binding protein
VSIVYEPDAYVPIERVAAKFNVSTKTVRRAIHDGRIRGIQLRAGGAWRIPYHQLRRLSFEADPAKKLRDDDD